MNEYKSKYIHTYTTKNGIFKTRTSIYEYRGQRYGIQLTGISHIDKYSHEQCQSQIDKIIKNKEEGSKMTESAQDSLNGFFDLIG